MSKDIEKETWLARFFDKNREIIEAAETPFAKLAIFILPVLAPLVPATMTGIHLYKLFVQLFNFANGDKYALAVSAIASVVLELLGYVGAISFIQSLFRWVKTRQDEYLLPFALNGGAYVFYLISMFLINVELGKYFGTPPIVNNIFGLLSFITVPTGLLAANHISQKESLEEEEKLRLENRSFKLEKYKIRYGNSSGSNGSSETTSETKSKVPQQFQNSSRTGRKPIHQQRVFSYLDKQLSLKGEVASFSDVASTLGLPQSTVSRLRNEWILQKEQNVQ